MTSGDYLAKLGPDAQKKMVGAKSADELVKTTNSDHNTISATMRSIATAELKKHGFPDWAINSMLLGEPVCW